MFILANGELEGIIWLVVIVMWGLGQLVNAIKKSQEKSSKQRQQPQGKPVARKERKQNRTAMQEFLESIAEQQGQMQPAPPPTPPQPDVVRKPSPKPSFAKKAPAKASKIEGKGISLKSGEISEPDHSKPIKRSSIMRSFRLPSVKLPKAARSMSGLQQRKPPRIDFNLSDNDTFKKAILYQEILGKPKALQPESAKINY